VPESETKALAKVK